MEDKIKALRAEADTLEKEMTYRKAYRILKEIERAQYDVRAMMEFDPGLEGLHDTTQEAKRAIALKLGHQQRVEVLVSCGMSRERAHMEDLLTDHTTAYRLATWLFDRLGHYVQTLEAPDECLENCPLGVAYWKEGNHDT